MHRKVRNHIMLYLGEDSIRNKEIEYSGVFQLYFSSKENQVFERENRTRYTVQILQNEPFSLNQNEVIVRDYINDRNIKFD